MLSVIIPTFNRNGLLSKCLHRLEPTFQTLDQNLYEVIVTDDSLDQCAKDLIAQDYSWVKWIEGPHKGPAANRNNGARYARGKWLIFIDDDCLPDKNILKVYYSSLVNNKLIQVFEGCTKANRDQKSFIEESPVNEIGGYLWACNFMIERKLFLNILDGFDETFPFAAMEDMDLNFRLKKLSKKVFFVKNAIVIHPWRKQKNLIEMTKKRFISKSYLVKKHPDLFYNTSARILIVNEIRIFYKQILKNLWKFKGRGLLLKISSIILRNYLQIRNFGLLSNNPKL